MKTQAGRSFRLGAGLLLAVLAVGAYAAVSLLRAPAGALTHAPIDSILAYERAVAGPADWSPTVADLLAEAPISATKEIKAEAKIVLPTGVVRGLRGANQLANESILGAFAAAGEPFEKTIAEEGAVYKPSFSSPLTFATRGAWVYFSDDETALKSMLISEKRLVDSALYTSVWKDLPTGSAASLWFRTDGLTAAHLDGTPLTDYASLVLALRDVLPAGGISARVSGGNLKVKAKMLATEGLLTDTLPERPNTAPQVLGLVPVDAALALTGVDPLAAYGQTETFFRERFPDIGALFSAAITGQKDALVGDLKNWNEDWNAALTGEYAMVLSSVSEGGDEALGAFVVQAADPTVADAIRRYIAENARGLTSPKIVTKELPDGSTRDEFEVQQQYAFKKDPVAVGDGQLHAAASGGTLSLGQRGEWLIVARSEDLARRMMTLQPSESLLQNGDVAAALRFDFSPSQGYGVVRPEGLKSLLNGLKITTDDSPATTLGDGYRRVVMARKFFPEAIYWDMTGYAE